MKKSTKSVAYGILRFALGVVVLHLLHPWISASTIHLWEFEGAICLFCLALWFFSPKKPHPAFRLQQDGNSE